MDTGAGNAFQGKHKNHDLGGSTKDKHFDKFASQEEKDKRQHSQKERSKSTPGQSKSSRFPSLSKIGRAHTFSFRRKTKDKENEANTAKKNADSSQPCCQKTEMKVTRTKSNETSRSKSQPERSKRGKNRNETRSDRASSAGNDFARENCQSWQTEPVRIRNHSSRGHNEETEDISAVRGVAYTSTMSSSSYNRVKSPRRKDCKRKEVSIDHGYDYDNVPLWLRNPPKILIQDFSSDYVDETTFDEEYFDLVQWAFHVLERDCDFSVHPEFVDLDFGRDDEPTLLGDDTKFGKDPLGVITNETARVGSGTLDFILHPISTGAANVLQTGAKFADFTSKVFRGISFDSIIKKRNEPDTVKKK